MRFLLGLTIGLVFGGLLATAILSHAECCGMFQEHGQPDFNVQLELERAETWQWAQQPLYIEPWRPNWETRKEPC
jgi:hypothetical protein